MATSVNETHVNGDRKLSKSQKKRLEEYQALGISSKARADKEKFDARYASLYQKSFSRRKRLDQLSMYQQFCEILSIRASRTLNPSNFLDFLASLITVYIGTNQTVSISKNTSNNHINNAPLNINHIDQLVPYYAPRDKVSFRIPQNIKNAMKKALVQTEEEQKHIMNESKQNSDEIFRINASYAFGALPDQRLIADGKNIPYVMDESFRWTILYGTTIKPRILRGTRTFQKIVAAAIISDGANHTYCIYGTRDGLFYNKTHKDKAIKLIDAMVDGIWRQHEALYVLCHGPVLYTVSLTTKDGEIAVNEVFRTKRTYNVYTFFTWFVGGYYDTENDKLILATNASQLFVFGNQGSMDMRFKDRFESFKRKELKKTMGLSEDKIEKGNLMYFDVDRNCVVYIGTKYVMKISLNKNKHGRYSIFDDKFGKIYDIKWFLRGITYDCTHFMYIYHQKTVVVLKRIQSSAYCPYVLKIYTGKSLRFE